MQEVRDAPSKVPISRSVQEEAEFWDTHDLTDFWDETRPVKVTISQELRDRVAARAREAAENALVVPLNRETREELAQRAKMRNLGPAALARLWIEERLRAERAAS